MCGFVGYANFKQDFSTNRNILNSMSETLKKRGPDEEGYYLDKNVALAHRRLIVIDPEGRETTYDRKIFFWKLCTCLQWPNL